MELKRIERRTRKKHPQNEKTLTILPHDHEKKQVLQEFVNTVVVESRAIHEFDADLSYRVFNGGGEGSRTPVRRPRCMSFYECSRLFWKFAVRTRSDTLPSG